MNKPFLQTVAVACVSVGVCAPALLASPPKDARCPVHHQVLKRAVVPIRYGKPFAPNNYWQAQQKAFPNANSYVLGGCIVGKERTRPVRFCATCRKKEAEWNQQHAR